MVPHYHAGQFLPKQKNFSVWLHPDSFSCGGSVIGHGIGGNDIPAKWFDLLKASCWGKQWQTVVTQSHSHSVSNGSKIQVHKYAPCSMGNSYAKYPPPHWLKHHRDIHRNQYIHTFEDQKRFSLTMYCIEKCLVDLNPIKFLS